MTYYKQENCEPKPALIYCHTFSGNKLEGKFLLNAALPHFTICLFDFRGCGNSSEKFVTLGIREKMDLTFVLRLVAEVVKPVRFYLWGRSMGAVTIIHYLNHQKQQAKNTSLVDPKPCVPSCNLIPLEDDAKIHSKIAGVILDSPFHDSHSIVLDVLHKERSVPKLFGHIFLMPVKKSIKAEVKFDVLGDNKPIKMVAGLKVPAFFMIGEQDELICQQKFKEMFVLYGTGKKELRIMKNTDHASGRNQIDFKGALDFLVKIEFAKKMCSSPMEFKPLHCKIVLEKIVQSTNRPAMLAVEVKQKVLGGKKRGSVENLEVPTNKQHEKENTLIGPIKK